MTRAAAGLITGGVLRVVPIAVGMQPPGKVEPAPHLKTAKALGLMIPGSVPIHVDEVIQ